jgi:hypothetical protein
MNPGVIVSIKWHYRADLTYPVDSNDDIIALWKKWQCWMLYMVYLGMIIHETSNAASIVEETSSRSRRWFATFS